METMRRWRRHDVQLINEDVERRKLGGRHRNKWWGERCKDASRGRGGRVSTSEWWKLMEVSVRKNDSKGLQWNWMLREEKGAALYRLQDTDICWNWSSVVQLSSISLPTTTLIPYTTRSAFYLFIYLFILKTSFST